MDEMYSTHEERFSSIRLGQVSIVDFHTGTPNSERIPRARYLFNRLAPVDRIFASVPYNWILS